MRKVTQKFIKELIRSKQAKDITNITTEDYNKLKETEGDFYKIYYSYGVYGINAGVVIGMKTGNWYAISCRSTSLYLFF